MSASFADLGTIAADTGFQARVRYAMTVAAVNVAAEDPALASHAARRALAAQVLGPFGFNAQIAALAVLTNATIAAVATLIPTPGATVPDGDIQFAVNSLWNAMAGA